MKNGKFNVCLDLQIGSTGKGLINSYLAWKHKPGIISSTNFPNAGHTSILPDGTKFVAKILPSSAILNRIDDYLPLVVIGAGAAFDINQLKKEMDECRNPTLYIHPRAGVITQAHRDKESQIAGGTKGIASTMQGSGAFLADKIMRGSDVSLAREYPELNHFTNLAWVDGDKLKTLEEQYLPTYLANKMSAGRTMLHEGSQGFGLDINHGIEYPRCTSRSCTTTQFMTDMGVSPQFLGDVYGVIRPYPIRVGNVVEDGQVIGNSGGIYDDSAEITWEEVAKRSGCPEDLTKTELTTVTKRLRKVYEWSDTLFSRAVLVNGVTKVALNFANYIDWSCYGKNNWDDLGTKVHDWIKNLEDKHQVEVALVGTGPRVDHVCDKYD